MTHNITPWVFFLLLLLVLIAALLCFCTESCCLEIKPRAKELVLAAGSSLSLTCSGSGDTAWEIKSDDVWYPLADQVQNGRQGDTTVQVSGAGTVMTLQKVTWKHTGLYQCLDQQTGEAEEVAIFVPGELCYSLALQHQSIRASEQQSVLPSFLSLWFPGPVMLSIFGSDGHKTQLKF